MTPGARVAAAIDVVADIEARRRPAADAIKDWGLAHRFAGSGDRAAIASLVYDALRLRASSAFMLGAETPRALLLGMLARRGGAPLEALFTGEGHAPPALDDAERAALAAAALADAPAHVAGDLPEWLSASFERAFGADLVAEGRALADRAPLDLRVNGLKAIRPKAAELIAHLKPSPTPIAPLGLRVPPRPDGRAVAVTAEPAYLKGVVEIQDEGSQIAALLSRAAPGEQALDLCAGGGGKTLALAAMMNNRGQIFATDDDARRLAPIHARIERAGARNVQVRTPRDRTPPVADLAGRLDLVLVDAPCTGTGTWRRNPDAKWRIRPGSLAEKLKVQDHILDMAADLLLGRGRLLYVTCSVLPDENDDRIEALLGRRGDLAPLAPDDLAARAGLPALARFRTRHGLQLSPHRTGTDGFYAAMLEAR
jgi:16S rRNA (cytosine967-C5)-methyltransferase